MENEVKKLKLNVTKIKSSILFSRKELKKTKIQKRELITRIEKKEEVKGEEKRLETKNLGIGSGFQKIAKTAAAPVKGIFDRFVEFFGLIALNILIRELPQIIQKIDDFLNSDFIKTVGSIFSAIGEGIKSLGQLFGILPQDKMDEVDEEIKDIEKLVDNDDSLIGEAEKNLETVLGKLEDDEDPDKEKIDEIESNIPEPAPVITPQTQQTSAPAPVPAPVPTPTPSPTPSPSQSSSGKPQQFSRGGTVKSEDSKGKPKYTPKESGNLKVAKRSMENGFIGFESAVQIIKENSEREEKNMLALSTLSKNLFEWGKLLGIGSRSGRGSSGGSSGSGSSFEEVVAAGDERELLLRLLIAEAGGEGKLGMAMVARSVLNRAGLIQGKTVTPGTYNSRSGSLTDVITAPGQYQPYGDGLLERDLSTAERARAAESLALAENASNLKEALKAQGVSDSDIKKMMAATGFRTGDAFDDPSQNVNTTKLGGHIFNTAGNSLMRSVRAKINESSLGDFEGNVISVGKAILQQGFTVGENKYFNKNNWSKQGPNTGGFNSAGTGAVGSHASSDHATNALDITDWRGSEASGIPRLKGLFLSLYNKRQQFGIKSLIYDHIGYWFTGQRQYVKGEFDGNHYDHLHVGFTISADTAMRREQTAAKLSSGSTESGSRSRDVVVVRQTTRVTETVPVPVPVGGR